MEWIVHKFGGTSLADASRFERVARILEDRPEPKKAVVVSAMGGVTNRLLELVELACARDADYLDRIEALRDHHRQTIESLLAPASAQELLARVDEDVEDLRDVLRAVWLLGRAPKTALDLISGYGELWSAQILSAYLAEDDRDATWLDARQVLVVRAGELGPEVDWEASQPRLDDWMDGRTDDYVITTGFIANDPTGIPTTLGRNGSDFSASIFASLLEADEIHIWTDVDGVMSANPRQVPEAEVLGELSYQEAMELAYFGAKVIHPQTMAPAVARQIPIYIRNTFHPKFSGTRIHLADTPHRKVKGFATIDGMALVNVEGTGMIGVPGIASRLFGALREAGISVVMISQASSEHSICFAVPAHQADRVDEAVEQGFFAELHHGQIQTIDITTGCSILAVVGDGMAGIPGVAATFFTALAKAGVNIRAIAQGSSERNISVVIDSEEATRALRAAHSGFYLSPQTLSVGVIGPGNVGATFLDQLGRQVERLRDERFIDIRVRGIASSKTMALDERAVDLGQWREVLDERGEPMDLDAFADHVQPDFYPHAVLVDCTASAEVASYYADWLDGGIHIVTPNKKANSGALADYERLRELRRGSGQHYLYETTVGAGLPIIQTLRDLIETGDEILEVEGILSGTLSYLFNAFDGSRPFSDILVDAHQRGYTEPDPRDDLSGMDVARKIVILAREMGLELGLADVSVESLVPDKLTAVEPDEFLARVGEHDDQMAETLAQARQAGQVLRFAGRVDRDGRAEVGLRQYAADHAFARIRLTDNIVQFRTRRYNDNPLIVQGPGAGPEVTAAGIFADLLRLATYVGAAT